MAFFCPGSSVKIKKEAESHKRPHSGGYRQGFNHSPYYPYYPSTGASPQHSPVTPTGRFEKVQDALSGPQPPISDQFLQKLIVFKDHTAPDDKWLTVRKGERVEVVQREEDRLLVRNERGKQGYVPSEYCAPPIASSSRRARSNSRSSMPLRTVASGEESASRGSIPMFSSNSAGRVKRSPCNDSDQMMLRRINSPPTTNGHDRRKREGSVPLEPKHSPSSSSGVASLSEQYSPALTRSYSQDALDNDPPITKVRTESLSQTPMMITGFDAYRKNSSSDDSGTMELSSTHYKDYASTIRNGDISSDDGSSRQGGRGSSASGNTTPSIRDRPLPSPPRGSTEEVPPPVPPRHTSLDRSGRHQLNSYNDVATPDDIDPYAEPVDTLSNLSESGGIIQPQPPLSRQRGSKSYVDVQNQNTGVDSPYSEVYRPKGNKRPINLQEEPQRNSGSFTRRCSPRSSSHGIERRASPQVNGGEHTQHRRQQSGGNKRPSSVSSEKRVSGRLDETNQGNIDSPLASRGMVKFRKCMWGVYTCLQDFEACDENEVSVVKGEHVLVLNQEDIDWFWIVKHKTDESEGFVPSSILSEAVGEKTGGGGTGVESVHQPQLPSPSPSPSPSYRPRASTSVYPSTSTQVSHRSRLSSTGNTPLQRATMPNVPSNERLPSTTTNLPSTATKHILMSPSSPPPPYAEKDPIGHHHHHHQQQPVPSRQSIPRNRPSYPGRSGRVSMQHSPVYPPSIQSSAHVSRSSTHLGSAHVDHNYPTHVPILNSPAPVVGGTLV